MEREVTKEEAEEIIATNRHKELAGTLSKIATSLSLKDDKEVVDAIKGQSSKLDALLKAIENYSESEDKSEQEDKSEISTKEFVSSIMEIRNDIVQSNSKVIEALENRLLPDTVTLVKGYKGITESVKVNYKPANKIKTL